HKYGMSPPQKYMTVEQQPFTMDEFLNHQLDVAHAQTYNEIGVVYEHGIKPSQIRVFDYNKLGVSILEDGIFAKSSWLQSHRSIAVRFIRASVRGWKWAIAHPNAAGQISYGHTPSGTTTLYHQKFMARAVAKLIRYGPGLHHDIGYMSPRLFHRTWGTLYQQGIIHHPPKNAYTQTYWRAAGLH
ncbi:MAG: ABC transporter substrate-binding protein, partial [Chloroflexota bacterium]